MYRFNDCITESCIYNQREGWKSLGFQKYSCETLGLRAFAVKTINRKGAKTQRNREEKNESGDSLNKGCSGVFVLFLLVLLFNTKNEVSYQSNKHQNKCRYKQRVEEKAKGTFEAFGPFKLFEQQRIIAVALDISSTHFFSAQFYFIPGHRTLLLN